MSTLQSVSIKTAFYLVLTSLFYVSICLLLFVLGLFALNKGIFFSNEIMKAYQRAYYFGGFSHVFQADRNCVVFDPVLLYKPKIGSCVFANAEFKTTLHFDENGRLSHHPSGDGGIAVVGDSHAMGWGVEDDETFSAIMERTLNRPVYNLSVSSYETYRELLRLEKSPVLAHVDTIVIQYCDNDLQPNEFFVSNDSTKGKLQFNKEIFDSNITPDSSRRSHTYVLTWLVRTVEIPIQWIRAWLSPQRKAEIFQSLFAITDMPPGYFDFSRHYGPLMRVLQKFPWINSKRVIIFYSNFSGIKFANYPRPERSSIGSPIFIDLDIDPNHYFAIDGHPTRRAHEEIARKLISVISH